MSLSTKVPLTNQEALNADRCIERITANRPDQPIVAIKFLDATTPERRVLMMSQIAAIVKRSSESHLGRFGIVSEHLSRVEHEKHNGEVTDDRWREFMDTNHRNLMYPLATNLQLFPVVFYVLDNIDTDDARDVLRHSVRPEYTFVEQAKTDPEQPHTYFSVNLAEWVDNESPKTVHGVFKYTSERSEFQANVGILKPFEWNQTRTVRQNLRRLDLRSRLFDFVKDNAYNVSVLADTVRRLDEADYFRSYAEGKTALIRYTPAYQTENEGRRGRAMQKHLEQLVPVVGTGIRDIPLEGLVLYPVCANNVTSVNSIADLASRSTVGWCVCLQNVMFPTPATDKEGYRFLMAVLSDLRKNGVCVIVVSLNDDYNPWNSFDTVIENDGVVV